MKWLLQLWKSKRFYHQIFSLTWCVTVALCPLSRPLSSLPAISLVALPWVRYLTSSDARYLFLFVDSSVACSISSRLFPPPSGYLLFSVRWLVSLSVSIKFYNELVQNVKHKKQLEKTGYTSVKTIKQSFPPFCIWHPSLSQSPRHPPLQCYKLNTATFCSTKFLFWTLQLLGMKIITLF